MIHSGVGIENEVHCEDGAENYPDAVLGRGEDIEGAGILKDCGHSG